MTEPSYVSRFLVSASPALEQELGAEVGEALVGNTAMAELARRPPSWPR
ncbi:hypothetical protein [Kribbella sp. NBC_00359]